jgi:hypothetical protein
MSLGVSTGRSTCTPGRLTFLFWPMDLELRHLRGCVCGGGGVGEGVRGRVVGCMGCKVLGGVECNQPSIGAQGCTHAPAQ